ncbi:MAG TPA: hypothetical protein VEJ87_14965 [Acidimicrobiales bacterium]|nr:hypothetical protein [Acidimicrobiales bacterium]
MTDMETRFQRAEDLVDKRLEKVENTLEVLNRLLEAGETAQVAAERAVRSARKLSLITLAGACAVITALVLLRHRT